MKIGIDTFGCDHGRSGLGSYLYYLVAKLPLDENSSYTLFGSESDRYTYSARKESDYISINVPDSYQAEWWWHFTGAKRFLEKNKFDVVLYAAASRMLALSSKVPGVAILNEVLYSSFENSKNAFSKSILKRNLRRVNKIIVSSNYIKQDLIDNGFDDKKIIIVPNGIDHSQFYQRPQTEDEFVDIKPFAIKKPYIIYPSRISSASKKHIELIKAFSSFKEKTKLPHRLVLAGIEDSYASEVHKATLNSPFASDIFITGFFPHKDFSKLYAGAQACIFPSISEGVGIPILEAMASGIPVACSDAGALPEISGGNALLFNSDNIEEFASSIETIVVDNAKRSSLIANGLEWSKQFTWEKTALRTLEILKQVAKEK